MPTLALLPLVTASWLAGSAAPVPDTVLEAAQRASVEVSAAVPDDRVPVVLFDENHPREPVRTVYIGRDGSVDAETAQLLEHLFRCKRTERHKPIDRGLLAMLADVAARYPGHTIEYVSAYRAKDSKTSRHRQARAFDFRIRGVKMTEVRDYVWTQHADTGIGVGWYPENNFVHMDHRPGDKDYAWTQIKGRELKGPFWAVKARRGDAPAVRQDRVGL